MSDYVRVTRAETAKARLVSDLNLPEANGGFTVIEEVRKAPPRCINFVLTGYPADDSFQRASSHEVAHYFTKPFEIEEMVKTIKQRIAARDSRRPRGLLAARIGVAQLVPRRSYRGSGAEGYRRCLPLLAMPASWIKFRLMIRVGR